MAKSAAIGLGLASVAGILVISGINGQSIPEVLKGEFGKGTGHPNPNPTGESSSTGVSNSNATTEPLPESDTAQHSAAVSPYGTALPPSQTYATQLRAKERSEKAKKLEEGLHEKEMLEKSVKSGSLTISQANGIFAKKHPHYAELYQELFG